MEFCVLGPLEVRDSDRPVAIGGGRRRALLALLLLHPNEVIPAEQLIDELWEGRPPRTAAKGLQVHVSHLRKELSLGAHDNENGAALLTRSTGYVLQVDPETIDAVRFEHALADAGRAREEGRTKQAAALLREGLALWRGPPLVDFAYEVFARDEIARLEELHLLALEDRIDADFAPGHHREVLAELEQLVAAHPSRERVRGLLMLGLHRSGRRPDALDVYHEGRERSIAELGLELGEDLRSLQEGILADDHALAAPPHGPGPTQRRPALVIIVGALLLACAAGAAFLLDDRERLIVDRPVVDVAVDAVAGVRSDGRPAFALPLPGRPTAIAAHGDQVYAVSVDASALTIADARTRRIVRTVPLVMRPAAVAARGNAVWIADARRGLAVRFRVGHAWVAARATWRRRPPIKTVTPRRLDRTSIAVAAHHAWVTDGSGALVRAGPHGDVRTIGLPQPADGVVAGAGAVWVFSHRPATVMRVDHRTARVTDVVPIAGGSGSTPPAPISIAASATTVWVLDGSTATLSRIDARTRRVTATRRLGRESLRCRLAAAGTTVWVACPDGSVMRVAERAGIRRVAFGNVSIVGVAASDRSAWIAAATAGTLGRRGRDDGGANRAVTGMGPFVTGSAEDRFGRRRSPRRSQDRK